MEVRTPKAPVILDITGNWVAVHVHTSATVGGSVSPGSWGRVYRIPTAGIPWINRWPSCSTLPGSAGSACGDAPGRFGIPGTGGIPGDMGRRRASIFTWSSRITTASTGLVITDVAPRSTRILPSSERSKVEGEGGETVPAGDSNVVIQSASAGGSGGGGSSAIAPTEYHGRSDGRAANVRERQTWATDATWMSANRAPQLYSGAGNRSLTFAAPNRRIARDRLGASPGPARAPTRSGSAALDPFPDSIGPSSSIPACSPPAPARRGKC